MERIGLYGGTFAPPHLGHIHAVRTFLNAVPVDRLLVMPTYLSPHKDQAAGDTPQLRLEMCRAAFGGMERVEISDYEVSRAEVSYTVHTLRHFHSPDRTLYLLCGTDMFLTLDKWYQPEEIFSLAKIVCVSRCNGTEEAVVRAQNRYRELYGQDSTVLSEGPLEISSTEIREAIRQGRPLGDYIPLAVEKIVRRESLYKGTNI